MLISGLLAVAISGVMARQIEQFVQRPDAPNLYTALNTLPQPFIDPSTKSDLFRQKPIPDKKFMQ